MTRVPEDPVRRAISVLNDALARDPDAVRELVNARVPCNAALAAHPTIRAGRYGEVFRIGVLGLINGVLGDSPSGAIGAEGQVDERTGRFRRIKRFVDLRDEKVDVIT